MHVVFSEDLCVNHVFDNAMGQKRCVRTSPSKSLIWSPDCYKTFLSEQTQKMYFIKRNIIYFTKDQFAKIKHVMQSISHNFKVQSMN